ncbi:division/cell wall cluster transcriptional repressor MraZ [Marinoscillum furvescens]|uniref:Transcriptional regulator MraZ n=1 Tax=Marinoscillum furvescens DSM 4134 TaxID=1122208 RepID=A0A3D9KXI9_MARFU|nr:division/cell wall cluster transcriptional repressor MraZ [Marinoscillum furvescens]RED92437.1 division/cell wall cluster transcriptional repressor MraZ [Marinoscillum furvescens DSM 4134]
MAFFTSEYECKLDTKGRLVLPAKIKANLPEVSTHELVIRKGFEPNLILYPMLEYKKIHAKIAALSEFNAEQRKLKRNFFRSIAQVELDNAGRILIPKQMLAHAGLQKEAVLIGMGNYIEMWNPQVFEEHQIDDPEEYSALAQKFLDE